MTDRSGLAGARPVSRRGFLRGGGGLALTLPWLESLPVRAEDSGKRPRRRTRPRRPCGSPASTSPTAWSPSTGGRKGAGASMEIGPGLEPMAPFREDMVFLKGLFNEQAVRHKSPHLGRMANMLSGAWVSTDQGEIRVGRTMDQVLAQQIGAQTAVPSLVLGIEPTELRLEDGLSMIYGSCISWASDTKPATKEIYPARVFDLLVGDANGRRLDRSILDEVLADARDLRPQVSRADRQKLDEYLESVRDIEKRIERASDDGRLEGWRPTLAAPNMPRPAERAAAERPGPHEADARPDRAGVPDGQDAHRHADAEQRPVADELRVPRRRPRQPAPGPHAQRPRARAREAMYLKTNQFHIAAVRLPRRPAEGDRRGRGHRCSTTPC